MKKHVIINFGERFKMYRPEVALNALQETGAVVLQDAASMLPVLALAPAPGASVLDLCAAPGSKTCQVLAAVGPADLVLANDLSRERNERTWRRAKSKAPRHEGLVVTAHPAEEFPARNVRPFDRVLADVPCSSDGTLRKDPGKLARWGVRLSLIHI